MNGSVSLLLLALGIVDIDGHVGDVTTQRCTATQEKKQLDKDEEAPLCSAFFPAAEAAFSRWRYEPATFDGNRVCVHATTVFRFTKK